MSVQARKIADEIASQHRASSQHDSACQTLTPW